MKHEWEVIRDTMASFGPLCRLREGEWMLHSWHPFTEVRGGGRIANWTEHMVCSVWVRDVPAEKREGEKKC